MKAMACMEHRIIFGFMIIYFLCVSLSLSGCSRPRSYCIPINEYEYSPGCRKNNGASVGLEYRECEGGLIAIKNDKQLFSSIDFGGTWKSTQEHIVYPYGLTDYGCHPVNQNVRYRIINENGMPYPVGCKYLEKSTDSGRTWTQQRAELEHSDISLSPRAIYYDNGDSNTIYVQPVEILNKEGKETFCVSHNGGETFRPILSIKGNLFAVSPSDPNILYAADYMGNVIKSTDAGQQWNVVLDGPKMRGMVIANAMKQGVVSKSEMVGSRPFELTVDPKSPPTAYIVTGYGILKTTDGGHSWCGIKAAGLAGSIFDLLIDPNNSQIMCLGTECGLFRSTNGGKGWESNDLK